MLIFSVLFGSTSCSQDDLEVKTEKNNEVDELYQNLMSQPTVSLLSIGTNQSRSYSSTYVPTFYTTDLDFLKSLNQEEFVNALASIMSNFDVLSEEIIDEIAINNYNSLMINLNGQDGISKLLNFASDYLHLKGGVEAIEASLPTDLNNNEIKYYIAMAVYVDRIARPFYSLMTSDNKSNISRSNEYCKIEAERKLLLCGCEFGLDTLIEIMTGGIDTEGYCFEDAAMLADLEGIYHDYEVCMGRWH